MPGFKDEHVLIIAPGSQTTECQLGLPESFTPPRFRFPSRMFPGQKPGQWEPLKIHSVTTTKTVQKPATVLTSIPAVTESRTNGVAQTNGESNGTLQKTEAEEKSITAATQDTADTEMKDVSTTEQATQGVADETAKPVQPNVPSSSDTKPDVEMSTDQPLEPKDEQPQEQPSEQAMEPAPEEETITEESFQDDPYSSEGAVYPIVGGRIENYSCFFAMLSHIYNMINPVFHMPVLVVSQPCWSARDHELITQYFFEIWKIPALCIMDSALTACYAYGVSTAIVVDVGYEKCDVSAVTDFVVNDSGRGIAIEGCGGQSMTERLQQVLAAKGFDDLMAEQLKKSPICEILPVGTALPVGSNSNGQASNPAAAASTGAMDSGVNAKDAEGLRPGQAPRGPGEGTLVGEEVGINGDDEENEGVLDVAAIVARDNAAELLAKREAEKAARAAAKKGGLADAARAARMRNSEKEKATFTYEEYLQPDLSSSETNGIVQPHSRKRKREIEVGVERFMAATPLAGTADGILDTIAGAIHSTVLGVPDIHMRSTCWDNLIVLGNGTRIRGFTQALLSTLASRYTLSPSTATIFTSELPSNFSTPVATPGTNTPIPGQGGHALHHPAGHGVNPLLVAATRNVMQPNHHQPPHHLQVPGHQTPNNNNPQTPGSFDPHAGAGGALSSTPHHRSGFSQSPTSIKTVKPPDYFPEWKDPTVAGMEEASFLGAQVAAKVIFIVDQGLSKGFFTRSEYNELGPGGIHECAL